MESKIIIVLPAYNASKTLNRTLAEIPSEYQNHIILVDDASKDNTVEIARAAGLIVFEHPTKRYGGNQKLLSKESLS